MDCRYRKYATLIACLSSLTASRVTAQVALIEGALKNVESLGMYYLYGGFHPRSSVLTTGSPREPANQTGYDGFGFELAISVGTLHGEERKCRADELPKSTAATKDTLDRYTEEKRVSGALTVTQVVKTRDILPPLMCKDRNASFQVAIGYSQIGGFAAQDTTFELKMALRELPSVAFYATYHPDNAISQYLGVRAGIVNLHSARAYDSTERVYTGGGSTFQAGIAAGLVATLGGVNIFVEPSYNIRKINSVEWTPIENKVPSRFPRELNFSGWQIALGIEVSIKPEP
jgi:hypothetical protein